MRYLSHNNYIKCHKCQHIDINIETVSSDNHIRLIKHIIIICRYYTLIIRILSVYKAIHDYLLHYFGKGINTKKYGTSGTLALYGSKPNTVGLLRGKKALALTGTNWH